MYGFLTKEEAEARLRILQEREPSNKFEVTPHSWIEGLPTRFPDDRVNELAARTWGVVRWEPYTDTVPWRNAGFVWFASGSY